VKLNLHSPLRLHGANKDNFTFTLHIKLNGATFYLSYSISNAFPRYISWYLECDFMFPALNCVSQFERKTSECKITSSSSELEERDSAGDHQAPCKLPNKVRFASNFLSVNQLRPWNRILDEPVSTQLIKKLLILQDAWRLSPTLVPVLYHLNIVHAIHHT